MTPTPNDFKPARRRLVPPATSLNDKISQISFLPWVRLDRAVRLGPVEFVPWSIARGQLPAETSNFVHRCFSRYLTNDGHPMSDITVACLNGNPTTNSSDAARRTIQRSVDVLAFAVMTHQLRAATCPDNPGFGISNSERFQLITQGLGDLDDHIVVVSGGYRLLWRIDDIHFCEPWCVGGELDYLDDSFAVALAELVHGHDGERIGRALEWFRLAFTGSDDTSEFSRIVGMATAYEILFDVKEDKKSERICTAIHELTSEQCLRTESVPVSNGLRTWAATAAWFRTFYRLRNSIVHGDEVEPTNLMFDRPSGQIGQRVVAALLMWEILMWKLFERGAIGQDVRRFAERFLSNGGNNEPDSDFARHVASSTFGIADVHRALGWCIDLETERSLDCDRLNTEI